MMKKVGFLLLLALVPLLLSTGCARLAAARPGADNTIEIVMDEYGFSPDVIRLQAGQTVTIRLRNEGEKMHEFMAGRDVQVHENLTEGFGEGFFTGIDVDIEGPGMVMGLEGEGMDMEGSSMEMDMGAAGSGEEHDEEMEMGGMEDGEEMVMGDAEHEEDAAAADGHDEGADEHDEEMEMGDMETEAEHEDEEMTMDEAGHDDSTEEADHAESGDEHDPAMDMGETAADDHDGESEEHEEEEGIVAGRFGAVQMPLMDAHAGLMIMIDPQVIPAGDVTTITFTVPESKVGTWEIGCFQERGQHYDDGMNGLIIVDS